MYYAVYYDQSLKITYVAISNDKTFQSARWLHINTNTFLQPRKVSALLHKISPNLKRIKITTVRHTIGSKTELIMSFKDDLNMSQHCLPSSVANNPITQ